MTRTPRAGERVFALLGALCVGSGCAALIYQVTWFQLLELVIGASSVSLGVLLATFMGGMCAGSFAAARLISPRHHPLRAFACLELGVGLCGVLVLVAMPALHAVYAELGSPATAGMPSIVLRATIATVCLLPPTLLMGATLPAVARWLRATGEGPARIGILYAANIFGAVAGSLLTGFYLLRFHDVTIATLVAATINGALALTGLCLASRVPARSSDAAADGTVTAKATAAVDGSVASKAAAASSGPETSAPGDREHARPVYTTIALSGLTALAAEVVWTRHLSLLLGATVYTFSLVLAAFLLGLGLGSAAGAVVSRRVDARAALGVCQLLLAFAIAWAAWTGTRFLPYWPLDVMLPTPTSIMRELDVARVLLVVLPPALLWGASFSMALAAAAGRERDAGRLMGRLYAANTLGAIVGALAASFVLIATVGSRLTQQWMTVISVSAALAMLLPYAADAVARRSSRDVRAPNARMRLAVIAAATAAAVASWSLIPALPGELVAFGRFLPTRAAGADIVYVGEGLSASVAVSRQANGTLTYHNAGKAQASTYPQDMRLQRMLGHLTTLVPDNGRSYLVIGLGAGITAGAVSIDPRAERVVVADLEPLTREVAGRFFREQNFGVVDAPGVELRIDDGRHFLLTTDETFDGITSDPFDPWVKGAAALYTREFWTLVRSRLNPGGVVTVFVQLYETTEAAVRSQLATFFEAFPNGAVFVNTVGGYGYDAVLLARADDTPIDVDRIEARLALPEYARVSSSLDEIGFRSATDLLGTYAGAGRDLAPWLASAVVNTDRNLRLQYLAGDGLNLNLADAILSRISSEVTASPEDYFEASPELMSELNRIVRARQGRF